MGYILKLKEDSYVEWSDVVDAPTSSVMTKAEAHEHILEIENDQVRGALREGGDVAERAKELAKLKADKRIERLEKNGTTSMIGCDLKSCLGFNRAGKGETHLKTVEEIIETYTYTPDKKGQWPWT